MASRSPARDRLLDAADSLVATRGWASVPVDAVLARAEVAPATLYAHFGSKDKLLAATLDRRLARWDETWSAAVDAAEDDRGRLLAVFDALTTFREDHGASRWCTFLGAAAEGVTDEAAVAEAARRDSALLRDRLVELAAPLAGARASELGEQLALVVTGALATRLRDPDADPARPGATARAAASAVIDAFTG